MILHVLNNNVCLSVKLLRLQGLQSFAGPLCEQNILGWPDDLLHARDHLMALSGSQISIAEPNSRKRLETLNSW